MLEQIMLYYGAACGIASALAFALHALGLSESKYGKPIVKFATDFVGLYQAMRPKAPLPAPEKK